MSDNDKRRVKNKRRSKKECRSRVRVGEPWPGEVEVQVGKHSKLADVKSRTILGLAWLFGALLALLAVYAVLKSDDGMIEEVFDFVRVGIGAVLVWAGGNAVLQLLSRIRLDDNS